MCDLATPSSGSGCSTNKFIYFAQWLISVVIVALAVMTALHVYRGHIYSYEFQENDCGNHRYRNEANAAHQVENQPRLFHRAVPNRNVPP